MFKTDLLIVAVVLGGIGVVWLYFQTANANHRRNLEISNLIVEKFFSQYERGSSTWITTAINLNGSVAYSEAHVEAALRFLLTLHRVRLDTQPHRDPQWVLVDGKP